MKPPMPGTDVDSQTLLWILLAACMVMLMQVGFLCLESGLVRAKNSINVAAKNLADFCLASFMFLILGFGLMFGTSYGGFLGTDQFCFNQTQDSWLTAFFMFQLVFCGTAATIISGAIAERVRFSGYLVIALITSAMIYPIFGHWAWGGALNNGEEGWLKALGFIDFAGSTVVHSVGAWTALAALVIVGPRLGVFDNEKRPIQGHNLVMASLGTLVLWFGWFGFNGGSALVFDSTIPSIILNTNMGAVGGGLGAMGLAALKTRRCNMAAMLNGVIAGLVGITANCHMISPSQALFIGAVAGILGFLAHEWLIKLRIDDAVGAVAAHGASGAWGTLAVVIGDPAHFHEGYGRIEQFGIQLLGVITCLLWTFGVAWLLLKLIGRSFNFRVAPEEEKQGLNISEHDASTELVDLLEDMNEQESEGAFGNRVRVEPHTEVGQIAAKYNRVLDRVDTEIHQRQKTADAYKQAKEEAEGATRIKDEFLANMSHEIRTPMNGVMGMLSVLKDTDPRLSEEQERLVDIAKQSADDLLVILNDILDFSKIEAGKMKLEQIEFSLHELLEMSVQLFAEKAHSKGVEIFCWVYHDVPELLVGDPTRLKQVLVNLIGNAVKFTEQGEITIRISVSKKTQEKVDLHISVDDTGIGIEPEVKESLFSAFTQADGSTTRRFGGTGLGLAICKSLVNLMEGRIGVESVKGRGSSFWFTARLGICEASVLAEHTEDFRHLSELRALIVDDHIASLNTVSHILEEWKVDVQTAESGQVALALLEVARNSGQRYDLAIVDYRMPGMDGLELARAIREDLDDQEIRLVLLTAHGSDLSPEMRSEADIQACLGKPILANTLLGCISRLTRSGRRVVRPQLEPEIKPVEPSMSILLAEDSPTNKEVALLQLKKLGQHEVHWARDGKEAIEALTQCQFDLVLMDCQMPGIDGYAATRLIRAGKAGESASKSWIVALTANAVTGDRDRCLEVGMNDYLSKPVQVKALREALLRAVEQLDPSTASKSGLAFQREEQFPPDLIKQFLTEAQELANSLEEALAAGAMALASRLAHTLKGVASNFQAKALYEAALAIEQATDQKEAVENPESLVAKLRLGLNQTSTQLLPDPGSAD